MRAGAGNRGSMPVVYAVVGAALIVLALLAMFLLVPISVLDAAEVVAVSTLGCVGVLIWALGDRS
jgi:hypothetical protein